MTHIKKLLNILTRDEKIKLILVLFGVILMGLLEVVGVGSIMPFLSVASNPEIIHTNQYLSWGYNTFGFKSDQEFLLVLGIAVIIFLFLSNASRAAVSYIKKRYTTGRQHAFAYRLLTWYVGQPYSYFLNQNSSELTKNILNEVGTVIRKVLMPGLEFISSSVVVLMLIGLLVSVNVSIALTVAVSLGLIYVLIYKLVQMKLHRIGVRRVENNRKRFKIISELFGGIKDVKLMGSERTFLKSFEKPSYRIARDTATSYMMVDVPKYGLESFAFGGIITLILVYIGGKGDFQSIIPVVGLYAFAGYRLMPALQKMFQAVGNLRTYLPTVDVVYKQLADHEKSEHVFRKERPAQMQVKDHINLNNIRYTYPGSDEVVIRNQSLTIHAKTTVGLVGPTGCGKTTLVDIILGLLEPQSGSLEVDGSTIDEHNIESWRRCLGYVPQSIYLADDTIADNIAFGVPSDEIDYEAVKNAAEMANIHAFIEGELQNKYDTMVGERGVRLSGGQRQRIGIARALYHNPPVLIMDEATSALDGLTESAIMDAIHSLSHKKTIIMIAHRLTTVQECDDIFIMRKGVVVDHGRYEDLLQRNADFKKMAEGSK
jgi:ATP-binding cassette, subfamily B, bacterial PglK